jgi:hypothetical protein
MNINGNVLGWFLDIKTGERRLAVDTHNVETYSAADIVAKLVSGDTDNKINYIGFIYGDNATPGLNTPARSDTWASIGSEIAAATGEVNIQLVPIAITPTFSASSTLYANNVVTFRADSDVNGALAYTPSTGVYADAMTTGDYYFHALLLNVTDGVYTVFARVSLDVSGTYPAKPAGWELSLAWPITFA